MKKVKIEEGFTALVTSFSENNKIEVLAKSILDAVETMKKYPERQYLHGIELEMIFGRAQALADYSKAASKRLGRKPRRNDFLNLVERASETVDRT